MNEGSTGIEDDGLDFIGKEASPKIKELLKPFIDSAREVSRTGVEVDGVKFGFNEDKKLVVSEEEAREAIEVAKRINSRGVEVDHGLTNPPKPKPEFKTGGIVVKGNFGGKK